MWTDSALLKKETSPPPKQLCVRPQVKFCRPGALSLTKMQMTWGRPQHFNARDWQSKGLPWIPTMTQGFKKENAGGTVLAALLLYCSSLGFSTLKDKLWHFSNVEQRWRNVSIVRCIAARMWKILHRCTTITNPVSPFPFSCAVI